jgi:hypothetical protein
LKIVLQTPALIAVPDFHRFKTAIYGNEPNKAEVLRMLGALEQKTAVEK